MPSKADDTLVQLERLGDLHQRGLLSDAEFERAKHSLLDGMASTAAAIEKEPSRRIGPREWMGTAAAALALLILGGYWLGSRDSQAGTLNDETVAFNETAELAMDPEPAPIQGGDLCGSSENYAQLKDMIFEKAAEVMGGDPVPLNTLKKAVSVRMELPVVSSIDEKVQRTDCTGRIVIDLPTGTRQAFDGDKSLEADLEYSFQPQADGNGYVIRAEGFGYMVQRLVGAAALVNAQRLAAQGGPQLQRTYNPSFDCGKSLTNVERMICQDEQLATADRLVSAKFAALRQALPAAVWPEVRSAQREFLKQRSVCADTSCVRDAYVSQWQTLKAIEEAATTSEAPSNSPETITHDADESADL